ncbi:MAG: hypothetical protein A3J52_01355 [Omnitrophica bacterium RIFCSPHIGHO2_02_FULL_49_9]|nr:MAG: hypothetical protein A3J52_01355 [Omnitrophica bacterium RIFCSPHIGHO2_02_FULL_49_9]
MKPKPFTAFFEAGLIGAIALTLYVAAIRPFSLFEIPVLKTQDLLFQTQRAWSRPSPVLEDFLLITIGDDSIERMNEKWPFKRELYAEFIVRLAEAKPKLIAFDFIFSGKGEPSGDFLLTDAIRSAGMVVLAAFVDPNGTYMVSRRELREAALGSGAVNKLLDPDLDVRRAALAYRDHEQNVVGWPWEIEIARLLRGLDANELSYSTSGVRARGAYLARAYQSGNARIHYRFNLENVEQISFWEVMKGEDWKNRIQGKTVLVGATSRALHDFYHTPFGLMPGVVINMNFLSNIVTGDFLRRVPPPAFITLLFLFVAAAAHAGLRFNVVKGLGMLILLTAGYVLLFLFLLSRHYLGDLLTPLALGWSAFLVIALSRYFFTVLENVHLRGKVITDPLTGLHNRRALEARIDHELEKLAKTKGERRTDPYHDLSCLMLDVDDFKNINDTYGHPFGDDVLKNVGFSIRENVRTEDLAARYGGEEFCVVLPNTSKDQAVRVAEKIRSHVESTRLSYVNRVTRFTLSIGVASAREDHLFATRALIRAADQALYEAKRTGKNKVVLYHSES